LGKVYWLVRPGSNADHFLPARFEVLEDDESIQASLIETVNALLRGTIELKRAELVLRALNTAVRNIRRVHFGLHPERMVKEIPDYATPPLEQVDEQYAKELRRREEQEQIQRIYGDQLAASRAASAKATPTTPAKAATTTSVNRAPANTSTFSTETLFHSCDVRPLPRKLNRAKLGVCANVLPTGQRAISAIPRLLLGRKPQATAEFPKRQPVPTPLPPLSPLSARFYSQVQCFQDYTRMSPGPPPLTPMNPRS